MVWKRLAWMMALLALLGSCGRPEPAAPAAAQALHGSTTFATTISATLPPTEASTAVTAAPTTTTSTVAPTTTTTTLVPTSELALAEVAVIHGDISPKSVVATGTGLVFAQNMMYRHTVTVYDRDFELVATIEDAVDLNAFGVEAAGDSYRGSPVEAAMTSNGAYAYVSNYQMYGPGYGRAGGDDCGVGNWDESFVYRIPSDTLQVDQVIAVGAVPKFLAMSPDDRLLLVSNWCTHDLSVVDTATAGEVARVPLGRHPRGIAITSDGATAYVAVMGSRDVAVVDLATFDLEWLENVGANPRHLVLDPSDTYLYVTLNGEGQVAKIDLATGEVVAKIRTGVAPRSMTISDDGRSLYVVNYESNTVSKVDADTMEVTQDLAVPANPIGITFDRGSRHVWVASYSGVITVFEEQAPTEG